MPHEAPDTSVREQPRVRTGVVLAVVAGALIFAGVMLVVLNVYYRLKVEATYFPPPSVFPAPRLQADPRAELAAIEAAQRRKLASYAWVDQAGGIASIPIDKAMAMIAARGAEAYAPLEPAKEPSPARTPEGARP